MSERGGIRPSSEPVTGSRDSSASDLGPQVSDVTRLIAQWRVRAVQERACGREACAIPGLKRAIGDGLAAVYDTCADQLTRVLDHEAPQEKEDLESRGAEGQPQASQ